MKMKELIDELQAENAQLREQNGQLRAENHQLREQVEELSRQVHELVGRLAKDSSNSSKPPSTDGYAKKKRSLRQKSGKKPGGQAGHPGGTRGLMEHPNEIVVLRPEKCEHCQTSLQGSSLGLRTASSGGTARDQSEGDRIPSPGGVLPQLSACNPRHLSR